MYDILTLKIGPLILSAIPISLILINFLGRIFSKYNPKLGSTTTICTNLIKTLTKDSMAVRTILFDKHKAKIENGENLIKITDIEKSDMKNEEVIFLQRSRLVDDEILGQMALITNLCEFEKLKPIEKVINDFFVSCGFSRQKAKNNYSIISHVPAAPEKKLSTVVVIENSTKEIFALTKGNPLHILKKCSKTFLDGKKIDLTPHVLRKIRKRIAHLNKNGEKTIGFAIKPLPRRQLDHYTEQFAENEGTYLGVIGIINPLNTDLEPAIELAKKAGIKIYILTKTKERKAVAIGKLLKLINPQYFEALTGDYLRKLPDQKIAKLLQNKEKDYVFAELQEEDKMRIIEILRNLGETVAIVRGGNKNKFRETVEGIRKGRVINRNYKKFYDHAVSCKIAELTLFAIAFMTTAPTPLSISLLIILDILINLALELSLRTDPLKEDVMTPKYHPVNTKFLNKKVLPDLLATGLIMGIVVSGVYLWSLFREGWVMGEKLLPEDPSLTSSAAIAFALLGLIQITNAIIKTKLRENSYLILTVILSALIIYALTSIDSLTSALGLNNLSKPEWQVIAFSLILIIIIEESRKYLSRKNETESDIA